MTTVISMVKDALTKSRNLSEAIARVWTNTEFFINHPEEGQKLADALYYVECGSCGVWNIIPKEKINTREWKKLQRILQKFCIKYEDILEFNNLPILLDTIIKEADKTQLCTVYSHITYIWDYIYTDKLTYKLLEATARVGSLNLKDLHYIYEKFED